MRTSSDRKHAGRGPASDEAPVPEPTFAERARTLMYLGRIGSADHKDALVLLARKFARVASTEATMTAIDQLGFHVRLKTSGGMRGARIAFPREAHNPAEARNVLVEMVQQALSQAK